MVKNGARIVVEPVKGFDDRFIAFLLLNMKNTNCNLIELVETKKQ
jgi:methylmalonyl-CoA/ethylmalonyl-CoA epimerase